MDQLTFCGYVVVKSRMKKKGYSFAKYQNMLSWLYSCCESPLRLPLFLLKAFKCGISAIFSISSPRESKMFLNSEYSL